MMGNLFTPNSQTQFIEDALFCSTAYALSYSDPDQKWIIRRHLISLLHNCPYLKPTVGIFHHNDGAQVKLLAATGSLPVSPPVPLTIWIHELYPHAPPMVFVDAQSGGPFPVYDNHPFVNPTSGATTSSYLVSWDSSGGSNPTDLVRSLVKLFNHSHPFYHVDSGRRSRHYTELSKMEAMDHLAEALFHDLRSATAEREAEIGRLRAVQGRLQRRAESVAVMEAGLEWERRMLKEKAEKVWSECDTISEWVKVHENWKLDLELDIDRVLEIEGAEEKNKWEEIIKSEAGDKAIEELLYKLDEALAEGVVGLGDYIKEVRKLAREQFKFKLTINKIIIQGGNTTTTTTTTLPSSSTSFH